MTCALAEDAVTETEQDAVAAPEAASAQLAPGLKASVGTEEEKLTVPVGLVATPADVLTTVAVTVTGCPTAAVELEREAEVEVVRLATVRLAVADVPLWTSLPA